MTRAELQNFIRQEKIPAPTYTARHFSIDIEPITPTVTIRSKELGETRLIIGHDHQTLTIAIDTQQQKGSVHSEHCLPWIDQWMSATVASGWQLQGELPEQHSHFVIAQRRRQVSISTAANEGYDIESQGHLYSKIPEKAWSQMLTDILFLDYVSPRIGNIMDIAELLVQQEKTRSLIIPPTVSHLPEILWAPRTS